MSGKVSDTAEKLSCVLVMPAYNEQDCIASVVRSWSSEFQRLFGTNYRLVVVDDGSRDRTGAILDQEASNNRCLLVIHQKNGGHGSALLAAYREAASLPTDYVFHVDSDDQFLPADFEKLWARRGESRFILGNRRVRHDAFHRLVITRILRFVILILFGASIADSNIPFRLIERKYLESLLRVLPGGIFAPNIFLAVLAARNGQKLLSIPVAHEDRKTGTVSIVGWRLIKSCFRSVRELVKFRLAMPAALRELAEREGMK